MNYAASLLILTALGAAAQSVPPAIFTDPPVDKAHPAKMTVIHIPTHGLLINGVVYQSQGAGVLAGRVDWSELHRSRLESLNGRRSDARWSDL